MREELQECALQCMLVPRWRQGSGSPSSPVYGAATSGTRDGLSVQSAAPDVRTRIGISRASGSAKSRKRSRPPNDPAESLFCAIGRGDGVVGRDLYVVVGHFATWDSFFMGQESLRDVERLHFSAPDNSIGFLPVYATREDAQA